MRSHNQSAIKRVMSEARPLAHAKHIDGQKHFIRETVRNGLFQVDYIRCDGNEADILTKPLEKVKLDHMA